MGTPFHADLSFPPGSPAGTYDLFDPGSSSVCVTFVSFSTDTACRFVIGAADVNGQRILAGYIGALAGAVRDRVWRSKASIGADAVPLVLIVDADCGFDVSIDGEYF